VLFFSAGRGHGGGLGRTISLLSRECRREELDFVELVDGFVELVDGGRFALTVEWRRLMPFSRVRVIVLRLGRRESSLLGKSCSVIGNWLESEATEKSQLGNCVFGAGVGFGSLQIIMSTPET